MAKVILRDGELVRSFRTKDDGHGHGVITGTVRLATADEYQRFSDDEYPKLKAAKGATFARATFFARLIRSWDVAGDDGGTLDVTPENVARLYIPIQSQLMDIVTGYTADPLSATCGTSSG